MPEKNPTRPSALLMAGNQPRQGRNDAEKAVGLAQKRKVDESHLVTTSPVFPWKEPMPFASILSASNRCKLSKTAGRMLTATMHQGCGL